MKTILELKEEYKTQAGFPYDKPFKVTVTSENDKFISFTYKNKINNKIDKSLLKGH